MRGRALGANAVHAGSEFGLQTCDPHASPARRPGRLRAGLCLAATLLLVLCVQNIHAEEAKPKLRGDTGGVAASEEGTQGGEDKTPPLRDEDGDPAAGGRGRDSTCAVPDEDKPKLRGDGTVHSAESRAANEAKAKAAREKASSAAAAKAKAAAEKAAALARPPNGSIVIADSADFIDQAAGKLLDSITNALKGGEGACRELKDSVLEFFGGQWANSLMLCQVHEFSNGTSVKVPLAVQNETLLFSMIYENATSSNDAQCQYWLGRIFEEGCSLGDEAGNEIVTKDVNQAAQLYMAAGAQVPAANRALGVLLQAHGDLESAASLYSKALEQGDVRALALLGHLYEVHGQIAEAVDLYRQGCKVEEPLAMASMALMLQEGNGVDLDPQQALDLLVRAAAHLECSAFYLLGRALEKGEGLTPDARAGAVLYEIAASMGHAGAAAELVRLHNTGVGVAADADAALHWAQVAEDVGMVWADDVEASEAKSEYAGLTAPLVGGRPSRYTYSPVCTYPLSEDEKSAQNRGFTGMDPTPRLGETARYRCMPSGDYFKLPSVLWDSAGVDAPAPAPAAGA